MIILYSLVLCGMATLSGTALIAFYWAARNGQFRNLRDGANVIFDEDEGPGVMTDAFPDARARQAIDRSKRPLKTASQS